MTILLIFLSGTTLAQDEMYFRSLLSGEILKEDIPYKIEKKNHYFVSSPLYYLDMNGDLKNEGVRLRYLDGDHVIEVYNDKREKIFSHTFISKGAKAQVHRLRFVDLGKGMKGLLVHFFEGISKHVETKASGRLYILSWRKKSLNDLSINSGPIYWVESRDHLGRYYKRRYKVGTADINGNGYKEIVVSSGVIRHVVRYAGKGKWIYR